MKKTLTYLAVLSLMAGCTPSAKEAHYPVLPEGLQDCKFYNISKGEDSGIVHVARCPSSVTSTTYKSGKATKTAVVIDGETYVRADKPGK